MLLILDEVVVARRIGTVVLVLLLILVKSLGELRFECFSGQVLLQRADKVAVVSDLV